jgi:hypothetical protein
MLIFTPDREAFTQRSCCHQAIPILFLPDAGGAGSEQPEISDASVFEIQVIDI